MIVKKIGTGTTDDPIRPDLPEGTAIKNAKYFDDYVEVEIIKSPEQQEKELEVIKASSQLIVAERILNSTLPKERIDEFAMSFNPPEIGRTYKQKWILRDPITNELFEVIKPEHTWQGIWKMEEVASEFRPHRKPGVILPWKQPLSTNPYRLGDKVTHVGKTWESMNDANVWEPGLVNETIWKEVV